MAVIGMMVFRVVPVRLVVVIAYGVLMLVSVAVLPVILCNLKRNGAKAE